jgi:hypothetical protein
LGAIVIAIGLAACASTPGALTDEQRLHLRAAASDFTALGIGAIIEKREDGRRTPRSSEFFEWWYFDGLLDDGTVVVIWFGDNWLYGSHQRTVSIEVTPQVCATPGGARSRTAPMVHALRKPDLTHLAGNAAHGRQRHAGVL